jgi:CDP-diacylglycerol--glycerol-3-phosphate 3-phosphatidyltransferase
VTEVAQNKPASFTDHLRIRFKGVLDPIGAFLIRLGLTPNAVTILGLVGNIIGAVVLATGHVSWGGLIILLAGPVDALDGTMARLKGEASPFGAFLDSVADRYSELIIYGGLLIYFIQTQNWQGMILVYFSAAGSVLVSYVKARAEGVGFTAKVGILTRVERYLVLAPALLFYQPIIGLWIIAILANFTAIQRIINVRQQAFTTRTDLKLSSKSRSDKQSN